MLMAVELYAYLQVQLYLIDFVIIMTIALRPSILLKFAAE